MGNLNISEWSSDQVNEWLSGLSNVLARYIPLFENKCVNGQRLLSLCCDDLDSLGVHIIGHQELLLEAIEQLRNFQYELKRENLQQLAMRLSVAATSLHNELRMHQDGSKVETQTLSDVAHVVAAVKPLVCWLDRSPFTEAGSLTERKSALLKLSLEAAICAQRDRFAEHPTRAVAAAAGNLVALADYIVQDVVDPMVLQPSSLDTVVLKQGERPLGFDVVPSFCGHHQIANIRFGSPAHACGKIEEGDEIVEVWHQTVIGWCGDRVIAACMKNTNHSGELMLSVRRRPGARTPALATPQPRPFRPLRRNWKPMAPHILRVPWDPSEAQLIRRKAEREREAVSHTTQSTVNNSAVDVSIASSSDESDALSPPASPTALVNDVTRMYPPKPRVLVQRRNTICCGSPVSKRPSLGIEQLWRELKNQKNFKHSGSALIHENNKVEEISNNLYRRDKAISYSTGLELTQRPKTCLGVGLNRSVVEAKVKDTNQKDIISSQSSSQLNDCQQLDSNKTRGKLDKSHSTPAYDFGNSNDGEPGSLITQIIPESPVTPTDSPTILVHSAEKADQILGFKKSSSQIGEALMYQQSKLKGDIIHNNKEDLKFSFSDVDVRSNQDQKDGRHNDLILKVDNVIETINIAIMGDNSKDTDKKSSIGQSSNKMQCMRCLHAGCEHVKTIQNELVQAINDQRLKHTKYSMDVPPEPPPRPSVTQKLVSPVKEAIVPKYPSLKAVMKSDPSDHKELTPLKPFKHADGNLQISVPLRHITKHDIHIVSGNEVAFPINYESGNNRLLQSEDWESNQTSVMSNPELASNKEREKDCLSTSLLHSRSLQQLEVEGMGVRCTASQVATLSPTTSVVRGIFPSSKSKSLKKKNSIIAKRRKVSVRELNGGDVQGVLFQRCRSRSIEVATAVWKRMWYVLREDALYGFKTCESTKADCLIFLNGFTVSAAPEVKSKQYAFKVYHTGTVFYFAAESPESIALWLERIGRATTLAHDSWERIHKKEKKTDESKHYSETDYSDAELHEKQSSAKVTGEVKEKDKSKFGSLKKFTNRIHKSESQESVNHSSTSLDRKYLRNFFSRKQKEERPGSRAKYTAAPVPTEHYRSYRRAPTATVATTLSSISSDTSTQEHSIAKIKRIEPLTDEPVIEISTNGLIKQQKKLPKPINYIHASNPNLLDFDKSDFKTKPSVPLSKPKVKKLENFIGFVTLEEFMLKKQEEERKQVYSNRVLMGIERDAIREDRATKSQNAAKELQQQWERIVPDVIYGELPTCADESHIPVPVLEQIQQRTLPRTPIKTQEAHGGLPSRAKHDNKDNVKPISVRGKDGYEKIVYTAGNIESEILQPNAVLQKILSRNEINNKAKLSNFSKASLDADAKDLGYEIIYTDEVIKNSHTKESQCEVSKISPPTRKNTDTPVSPSSYRENKLVKKTSSQEIRKPSTPPRIMPKSRQVLDKQSSLTSSPNRQSPGMSCGTPTGTTPPGGESSFWLNSLRRNDRVHSGNGEKSLKSATQYTPMVLPMAMGSGLATAPHLQMTLDANTRDPSASSSSIGVSRLRQIFQGSGASKNRGQSNTTSSTSSTPTSPATPTCAQENVGVEADDWPLMLAEIGVGIQYPHLECPPTFEPESYSLAERAAKHCIITRPTID